MTIPGKRPKAILLDLDDTITSFDSVCHPAWMQSCEEFVAHYPVIFSSEALYQTISQKGKWYWGDAARHKIGRENLKAARREVVTLALEALDIRNIQWAYALADHYTALQDSMIDLLPGARDALTLLRDMDIRLGVVTNGASAAQREKIRRFNIGQYFEHILIDTETGYSKPDVRAFENALQTMGVVASDVWMAGDNLQWDVFGAQQAGIFAVWNDHYKKDLPPKSKVIPDLVVHSIYEMAKIIENI
jgi:putative hydrolase of the HAD superfamily